MRRLFTAANPCTFISRAYLLTHPNSTYHLGKTKRIYLLWQSIFPQGTTLYHCFTGGKQHIGKEPTYYSTFYGKCHVVLECSILFSSASQHTPQVELLFELAMYFFFHSKITRRYILVMQCYKLFVLLIWHYATYKHSCNNLFC